MKQRIALILGCLSFAVSVRGASIDEILAYRSLGEVEVAPDGNRAAFVATSPNFDSDVLDSDIWLVEVGSGRHLRLTTSLRRDFHPRWSPDGGRLAFLSDRSEKTSVWVIDPDGGEAEPLVEPEGEVEGFEWLPDGSGVVFAMTDPETEEEKRRKEEKNDPILVDRSHKFARLYLKKLDTEQPILLTPQDEHVNGFDVSPTGAQVVLSVQPTPEVPDNRLHSDLKILDLDSGEIRVLVRRPGLDLSPRFSPDGRLVAFVSMDGRGDWIGNYFVCVVGADGQGLRNVSSRFDERVSAPLRWSPGGKEIYFLGPERTNRRVWGVEVATGELGAVSAFDEGKVVSSFGAGKDSFVLAVSDSHNPEEIYVVGSVAEPGRKLTAVNEDYPVSRIGQTEIFTYTADDGLELEGLLVKPLGSEPGKRYPLLVVIHGGPSGVFAVSFSPSRSAYPIHAFSEEGYLLFLPNPRGSGGYGDRFRRANFRDWGYGDFRDIMTGVDRLIDQGLADPDRMGVMGWSYGGFMTSWIVTQTSRFKAASIGAPVTNPYSFYGTTDIPEFMEAYFGGKPWDAETDYLRHAPEHHVAKASTPSLILHGKEDRRVPLSQGEAFYRGLKKSGVTAEMVVYPRTPHGLREPKLVRDALQRNLDWFRKWLGNGKETTNN